MFKNLKPLDREAHRHWKYRSPQGFGFASGELSVPVTVVEAIEICKYYPIVFPDNGAPTPQALLTIDGKTNAYVGADGSWKVPYIPAHIRRYPIILGPIEGEVPAAVNGAAELRFNVLFDDEGFFNAEEGEPLFTASGEDGPLLKDVLSFVGLFQNEWVLTERLAAELDKANILVPQQVEIQHQDGSKTQLGGFRTIDPAALAKVDGATFLRWRESGLLTLIYAHQFSLSNIGRMVN